MVEYVGREAQRAKIRGATCCNESLPASARTDALRWGDSGLSRA